MTSRDVASAAVSGFKVFGSERSDTTTRPPAWPISPGTESTSWLEFACCECAAPANRSDVAQAKKILPSSHLPREIERSCLMMSLLHVLLLSSPLRNPGATQLQVLGNR